METCNINKISVPLRRKCGFVEVPWKLFGAQASLQNRNKYREDGFVVTNLVIVRQIYDLQLRRAVIAFLLHIIYWHLLPI